MPPQETVRQKLDETVAAVRAKVKSTPRIGVVLGSGLGGFGDTLKNLVKLPYADLPHLPVSRVVGHSGNLCFGDVAGVQVVCMQGRVHYYEGHSIEACVHGARTMARLGVECVLLTNAAGGVEASWSPGDLMIVTDHLNLMGTSPLLGPNDDTLGPRFPDMTEAYDVKLRETLNAVGAAQGTSLRAGVYAALTGPSYETPAEVRMLRGLGAQAVGMSTVPEVLALRHMGVKVAALSCITNLAAGITNAMLNHAEVERRSRAGPTRRAGRASSEASSTRSTKLPNPGPLSGRGAPREARRRCQGSPDARVRSVLALPRRRRPRHEERAGIRGLQRRERVVGRVLVRQGERHRADGGRGRDGAGRVRRRDEGAEGGLAVRDLSAGPVGVRDRHARRARR